MVRPTGEKRSCNSPTRARPVGGGGFRVHSSPPTPSRWNGPLTDTVWLAIHTDIPGKTDPQGGGRRLLRRCLGNAACPALPADKPNQPGPARSKAAGDPLAKRTTGLLKNDQVTPADQCAASGSPGLLPGCPSPQRIPARTDEGPCLGCSSESGSNAICAELPHWCSRSDPRMGYRQTVPGGLLGRWEIGRDRPPTTADNERLPGAPCHGSSACARRSARPARPIVHGEFRSGQALRRSPVASLRASSSNSRGHAGQHCRPSSNHLRGTNREPLEPPMRLANSTWWANS